MAFEKSFLDIKKSFNKSKESLNIVRIAKANQNVASGKSSSGSKGSSVEFIEGILSEEVELGVKADWERLLNLDDVLGKYTKFVKAAGYNALSTGKWTQKYYKGGGYMAIPVKFRIVDWDGTGNVVPSAKKIMSWALPKNVNFGDSAGDSTAQAGSESEPPEKTGNLAGYASKLLSGMVNEGPSKVVLEISNYISSSNLWVITNVKAKFSKELTENGPLYVDMSIDLESFLQMDTGSIPLNVRKSGKVSFVNGTGIPTRLVK